MSNQSRPGLDPNQPLEDLDHWEDFLKARYPESEFESEPAAPEGSVGFQPKRDKSEFRDYRKEARPSVKEFYRLNHTYQTFDFVRQKREQFLSLDDREMGIWEAMEYLNTRVEENDPDTDHT